VLRTGRLWRLCERDPRSTRIAELAAVVSTIVSATVGVASLLATGDASPDRLATLWVSSWSGDAIGDLLVAPLILTWAAGPRRLLTLLASLRFLRRRSHVVRQRSAKGLVRFRRQSLGVLIEAAASGCRKWERPVLSV
jgi:hypothetical protein